MNWIISGLKRYNVEGLSYREADEGSWVRFSDIYQLSLHCAQHQDPVVDVPSTNQYHAYRGIDNDKEGQFGNEAWGHNEEADGRDFAHAEGFYLGWTTHTLLQSKGGRGVEC